MNSSRYLHRIYSTGDEEGEMLQMKGYSEKYNGCLSYSSFSSMSEKSFYTQEKSHIVCLISQINVRPQITNKYPATMMQAFRSTWARFQYVSQSHEKVGSAWSYHFCLAWAIAEISAFHNDSNRSSQIKFQPRGGSSFLQVLMGRQSDSS